MPGHIESLTEGLRADILELTAENERLRVRNERMAASVRGFMSSLPFSAPENLGFLATAKLGWIVAPASGQERES